MAQGTTPKVEDAAEHAHISRTTAYRYFPNQRALLLAAQPHIQPDTLLDDDAPDEPSAPRRPHGRVHPLQLRMGAPTARRTEAVTGTRGRETTPAAGPRHRLDRTGAGTAA
ncbi:TetR family transcriptional regulator [Allorhizocola rhizosphaerae]|uniref:TetR family transcriptional regulator n=1 Tax=Allorhizocola rhizosphaerae TaxID=1872709 RepID=UPI001FE3AD8E|nr:TetR family transcriptional regulator [Allorhizocola rhizosphaerae]